MHTPVLKEEVLYYLNPKPGENFIDATCGFAGHSQAILEKNAPNGKVLGIEWDQQAFEAIQKESIEGLLVVNDSYADLQNILNQNNLGKISGVLFDLGMSSDQVDKAERGFSFTKDGPLDMRFSQNQELTAAQIVNQWPQQDIAHILRDFGQERFYKLIAKNIIKRRQRQRIIGTHQLVDIIKEIVPRAALRGRTHPATKTFQALRITVNNELGNLEKALPQALQILEKGGRLCVISFHSLEDKIVKNFFKEQAKAGIISLLTKKPIIPQTKEIQLNPRSRSAKLRAAVKN
ncbi:MAG: 16S rRNA (cytosine(1402)-N(4))-methyltransferase RsmH [Candidatus Pacebacteria bacterium]|nr:16S rRNA (cytosine(1402)-N(4))-methyltransferase RsmH [Candidatus Paceibacterota bacterium]